MKEKTRKFKVPHSLAIIIAVMLAAALLTYIIPGGAFDRVKDEGGLGIVLATGMFQGAACSLSKKAKGMATTGILLGFAYAISGILSAGGVMDTVVNAMANALGFFPAIIQAPVMFFMHVIINFFVTSGSGQAAVTMPIFIPVADLVGMSRQTAVLAFNFGDGFCNFILPHAAATMNH